MELNPRYKEIAHRILNPPEMRKGSSQIRFVIFVTILLPKVYFIEGESRWFSTFYIVGALIVADLLQRIIYKRFKAQIDDFYSRPPRIKAKKRD
jgi:hypothetical protein